jgi:hypothetical protein
VPKFEQYGQLTISYKRPLICHSHIIKRRKKPQVVLPSNAEPNNSYYSVTMNINEGLLNPLFYSGVNFIKQQNNPFRSGKIIGNVFTRGEETMPKNKKGETAKTTGKAAHKKSAEYLRKGAKKTR